MMVSSRQTQKQLQFSVELVECCEKKVSQINQKRQGLRKMR